MAPPVFLIMYRMKEGLLKSAPSLSQIFTDKKYGNHEAEFPLGSHSSKNSWAITSIALPVQVYALSRKALPVSASKFSAQPSFCTILQKRSAISETNADSPQRRRPSKRWKMPGVQTIPWSLPFHVLNGKKHPSVLPEIQCFLKDRQRLPIFRCMSACGAIPSLPDRFKS